jgi:hypothetical protein
MPSSDQHRCRCAAVSGTRAASTAATGHTPITTSCGKIHGNASATGAASCTGTPATTNVVFLTVAASHRTGADCARRERAPAAINDMATTVCAMTKWSP